jgi:hypothetical protein
MILGCFFRQYDEAVQAAEGLSGILDQRLFTYAFRVHFFYDSLARLGQYPGKGALGRARIRGRIRANQRKLRRYSQQAPQNFLHKVLLIEAEQARVGHRERRAEKLYRQAIATAKEHDQLLDEALATECAAYFFLSCHSHAIAKGYMMDARYAYLKWGAMAKVQQIDSRFGALNDDSPGGSMGLRA